MLKILNKKQKNLSEEHREKKLEKINTKIKKITKKRNKATEQNEKPKMGIGSFGKAGAMFLGGVAMLGTAKIIKELSAPMPPLNLDISPVIPINLMQSPADQPLFSYAMDNGSKDFTAFSNGAKVAGMAALGYGMNQLSKDAREKHAKKNASKKEEFFNADIKNLQKKHDILSAGTALKTLIADKQEPLPYPELKNIQSFNDFSTQIKGEIEKPDSQIGKLYTEFSEKYKNIDDDEKKDIFADTLFNNVLKVTLEKSFDDLDSDIKDLIGDDNNKFKNDSLYKDTLLDKDNNIDNRLTKVDGQINSLLSAHQITPDKNKSAFKNLFDNMESIPKKSSHLASALVREYVALRHKKSLKDKPEYAMMQERCDTLKK